MEIPDLTESILQNLEPAASGVSEHQDWYYEALVNQQIFPWLWDLDISMLCEKKRAGHWDWELLVRQLSRKTIHEPDDVSIKLPLQLRNRRRIWRLLEEARVGDVAKIEERLRATWEAGEKWGYDLSPTRGPPGSSNHPNLGPPPGMAFLSSLIPARLEKKRKVDESEQDPRRQTPSQ